MVMLSSFALTFTRFVLSSFFISLISSLNMSTPIVGADADVDWFPFMVKSEC